MSSATVTKPMTADEFLAWATQQPEGEHYELVDGQVVAMSPERSAHGLVKVAVAAAMRQAIRSADLPCYVYVDSMAVRVDASTVYEPDVLVRCGPRLDPEAMQVTDPVIVVEVVSPSSRNVDTGIKLEGYFRIPSVRHYLILRTETRSIIHHRRDDAGAIATSIIRDGAVQLDPPGVTIDGLFADL